MKILIQLSQSSDHVLCILHINNNNDFPCENEFSIFDYISTLIKVRLKTFPSGTALYHSFIIEKHVFHINEIKLMFIMVPPFIKLTYLRGIAL